MQVGMIEGMTRVIGKSQGYIGLPLRDTDADGTPIMESAWFPTPKEITAMNNGAPVVLRVIGSAHPPVMLTVGEEPKS